MNIILIKHGCETIEDISPDLKLENGYNLIVTISNEGLKG